MPGDSLTDRVFERIDRGLAGIAATLGGLVFVCLCLQVFSRYVLHAPLVWTDELARYMFVWSTLLAAAVIAGRNGHYSIPILFERLGPDGRRILALVVLGLCVVFALIIAVYGARWAGRLLYAQSPVLGISQGGVYAVVPVAAAYMVVRLGWRMVKRFRRQED